MRESNLPPLPPCLWPWGDRDMGRGRGRARRKERELEESERENAEGPSVLIIIYLPISSPWHCTQRGGGGAEGYGMGEITTDWWGRGRGGTVRGREGGGERGGEDWFSTSSHSPFPSPSASPHCHPLRVYCDEVIDKCIIKMMTLCSFPWTTCLCKCAMSRWRKL